MTGFAHKTKTGIYKMKHCCFLCSGSAGNHQKRHSKDKIIFPGPP